MNISDIHTLIRKLAKSDYYQSIFSLSKERLNFRIFKNDDDFTDIQMLFIRFLNFYYILYTDIALGDVSEIVLDNEIYEDSYMLYKNKMDKKKLEESKQEQTKQEKKQVPTSKWIFKKSPK